MFVSMYRCMQRRTDLMHHSAQVWIVLKYTMHVGAAVLVCARGEGLRNWAGHRSINGGDVGRES